MVGRVIVNLINFLAMMNRLLAKKTGTVPLRQIENRRNGGGGQALRVMKRTDAGARLLKTKYQEKPVTYQRG